MLPNLNQTPVIQISAHNLTVAYHSHIALHIPDLSIEGRIIGIIGHNGSGKSTLIKSLLQLLPLRTGMTCIVLREGDKSVELQSDKHMAFAPENGSVFEDIPVEDYLKLWCRIKHRDGNYYKNKGSIYIERLNIAPLLRKLGRNLSKGERRRVQAAAGFLIEPKLFFFDEPFDGLDVIQTQELADVILEESAKRTFVISSHRMDIVERVADKVIVLRSGNLCASGSVLETCYSLCGESIVISNDSHNPVLIEQILLKLRSMFPSSLIQNVGNKIILVGHEIELNIVRESISGTNDIQLAIERDKPSLVDAMSYHLKKLQ